MNKIIKSLMAFVMVLGLGACSSEGESEASSVLEKVKEKGVLVVATSPDYAPLEFLIGDSSSPVGAEMTLAKYIADDLGVELQVTQMDFSAVLTAVSTGNADIAISGFGYRQDRAESFELSYGYNKDGEASCHGLMIPAGTGEQYKTLADFEGKLIAAQNGSLQQGYTEEQIPTATVELISDIATGVMMLETGKVDAMAMSCDLGIAYANTSDNIEFSEARFVVEVDDKYDGNVMAVAKGETDFVEYLNTLVEKINAEGLFDTWNDEAKKLAKDNGIEFEE